MSYWDKISNIFNSITTYYYFIKVWTKTITGKVTTDIFNYGVSTEKRFSDSFAMNTLCTIVHIQNIELEEQEKNVLIHNS